MFGEATGPANNIKNKVKNIEKYVNNIPKYLPNPAKVGSKSAPATLLGALLQKVALFHQIIVPLVAKWEPRGSHKITKNHKKTKKEGPQNTSKNDTLKNIEN